MGAKKGLDSFSIPTNLFGDAKFRKLTMCMGGRGASVYLFLLCEIFRKGYSIAWDKQLIAHTAAALGFDEAYVTECAKTCAKVGLFCNSLFRRGVLTSEYIQRQYFLTRRKVPSECNLLAANTTAKRARPPRRLTVAQECRVLKKDTVWIKHLQTVHLMDEEALSASLDSFASQCLANGVDCHDTLQDAKKHFNSWLRKIKGNDIPEQENKRKGNLYRSEGEKDYGGTF